MTLRHPRYLAWLVGILAVVIGAIAVADRTSAPAGDAWSPIVYPAQRLPLHFSHGRHLARGATCTTCHPNARTSRSAVDNLLPTEAACRQCHPIDRAQPALEVRNKPPAHCAACHVGYSAQNPVVQRVYLTPSPLKFDHAAHAATPCATCHGDLTRVDLATTRHLPTMQLCLSCHKQGQRSDRCMDCHFGKRGGFIETEFPHGRLVPRHTGMGDGHHPGFLRDHRHEAMQQDATCTACHDQSECLACHQGVVKPMDFHPGDYLTIHGVEAMRGKPDCSTCHRASTFCVACHERSGIGPRAPTSAYDAADPAAQFHPPGWAATSPGSAMNQHAREARRNITSCASCHREETCLRCHSADAASLSISPHGPGWSGSARCKALDRGNRRACLRCHVTPDELGCDWRR